MKRKQRIMLHKPGKRKIRKYLAYNFAKNYKAKTTKKQRCVADARNGLNQFMEQFAQ